MRFFGLLLLLTFTATAALAYHNWPIFIAPNELSLGFTTIQAPIGLVLLGTLIFITVLFLMNMVYMQSTSILESRRYSKELEANKELVNDTEKSRFTELKNSFETELSKQSLLNDEIKAELFARYDLVDGNFRTMIEEMENTLDAYIGELEDRLERTKYLPPSES
ncbi:hypothetical protein A1359_04620 [Methylomonas lenta]|uniref:Signal transduction histidine kinase n=1 Tax=Methylomonas lenta TaxID=980561 RepID=A0A177NL60_9GAMM|nr:hypothetical protein [Methylomonas lenta]OAI18645.1 hypothetical protein A1359_04620 [Methylomonas lenta]